MEKEADFVKVRSQPGGFNVTVPKKAVAIPLGIQGGEHVKVYVDLKRRRWTYEMKD